MSPQRSARRRRGPVGVAVVAFALAISVVWAWAASTGSSAVADRRPLTAAGDRVLLVGDSLLWQSTAPVAAALRAERWEPTITAAPSTTIEDWARKVDDLITANRPDVVVVELGTNNCTTACGNLAATIDRLMRNVPSRTPVLWLDVQNQPTYPAHPESVNDALAAAHARWPNLTLVSMSAHFRNHPEWHVDDGLHFSAAGSDQLGVLIAQSLRDVR